jgi:predicted ribosome quality control (RQC) complex YloA/Tae2 family protein
MTNVNLDDIEAELNRARVMTVIEQPHVNDIGRLSAAAVQEQFEFAAQAVEELGDELQQRRARLEAATHEIDNDLKLVAKAAALIRDKGQRVYAEIEQNAELSKEIRAVCQDIVGRVRTNDDD